MLLSHALVLAEARSYVAALADHASGLDASMEFERVLLQLDMLHGGAVPPTTAVPTSDPTLLAAFAEEAISRLAEHGVDLLELEICLAMLQAALELDARS